MGRAVVPSRQRLALARGPLPRVRATLPRDPVEARALGQPREELLRELDVELDRSPDGELVAHREVGADVIEERPSRAREVAAVDRQPANRPLARVEHQLLVPAGGGVILVLDDLGRDLAVNGAAEAVHVLTYLLSLVLYRPSAFLARASKKR